MSDKTILRGLTWDHPRAYEGLDAETAAFNRMQDRCELRWDRHSLRQFEARPIAETSALYDLVILDHPFMGDAAASGCLVDLHHHARELDLQSLSTSFIGPSFASYAYAGGLWALPIDAACQTAAVRPDLLHRLGEALPTSLAEVLAFAERHPIALALACPHAFMNFLSLCALLGADISGTHEQFLPRDLAAEALDIHRRLAARVPQAARDWSSIGLLDAMVAGDDIAYCPMVFCFNSYTRPSWQSRARLTFANIATVHGRRGAIAGGAGLALSISCRSPDLAIQAMAHLMSRQAQLRMALAGGQPARTDCWQDTAADEANGRLFSSVAATMQHASLRPRHPAYMAFQNQAGDLLRDDAVARRQSADEVLDTLQDLFEASRRLR